ncbi:hypothetical protein KCP71_07700 [Salmonella enterica subsp. enterica]|nr:hypothetical protein KCP71_07700 [Salmonella enterica subsp. enterica]
MRGRPVLPSTFRSAKSMNMRRRRTNRHHRISRERRFSHRSARRKACDRTGRPFYACPRASVFMARRSRRPSDARRKHACHGRDKQFTGVVLQASPWLVMRTTTCWSVTAATTRSGCPRSLLRSGFGGRVQVV